jgi:phosphoribosylformimino-5-aminoimidazole carboxamide ribotide isomerase
MRLIPAIDLRGGRCVRLRQGDFDAETVFAFDPLQLLERYRSWGADWLHVVDLDAAREPSVTVRTPNRALIDALIAENGIHVQVGGGLRSRAAIADLLDDGAGRVVVGSLAVNAPAEVTALIRDFGANRMTIALDVRIDDRGTPHVATHGWRQQTTVSLWAAIDALAVHGLTHVLCTDVARDGMLAGPNLELYREARRRHPAIEWQASGGIRHAGDLAALAGLGVAAAVSGRALLENLIMPEELRPFLPNA